MKIADENGKETPLRRYDRKTIVLTLPSDLTVFDIGHFGVWCEGKYENINFTEFSLSNNFEFFCLTQLLPLILAMCV